MKYRGNIQAVPYYEIHESVNMAKLSPILKGLHKIAPNRSIPFNEGKVKKHLSEWLKDPLNLSQQVTPHNMMLNLEIME